MNEIQIVIGSWGSYNECNEKALGSKWLNLADYEDWSEIEKELTKEGFKLKGIDEELKKVQKNNKQYGNIYDILGESLKKAFPDAGWVDDAMQGVETYVGFTISQLQSLLQAQVQLK